jgi:uncharacterized Tic20 family protein
MTSFQTHDALLDRMKLFVSLGTCLVRRAVEKHVSSLCAFANSQLIGMPISYGGRIQKITSQSVRRGKNNMNIIISLIIYLVIFGLIWWLVSMLPLPAPVAQIVRVLFIILLIIIILSVFGIIPGGYLPKLSL